MEVQLYEELLAALRQIPDVGQRVHEGGVIGAVEQDAAGYIRPYLILFAGLGGDLPAERPLDKQALPGVVRWRPRVQCVGATAGAALRAASDVKKALTGLRIGNHWLKPDANAMELTEPLPDVQVSPIRYFLPTAWEVTTA